MFFLTQRWKSFCQVLYTKFCFLFLPVGGGFVSSVREICFMPSWMSFKSGRCSWSEESWGAGGGSGVWGCCGHFFNRLAWIQVFPRSVSTAVLETFSIFQGPEKMGPTFFLCASCFTSTLSPGMKGWVGSVERGEKVTETCSFISCSILTRFFTYISCWE